jgi:hypothetical protein
VKLSKKIEKKNAKRVSEWREKQTVTENVTDYVHVRNAPNSKVSKGKVNKDTKVSNTKTVSEPTASDDIYPNCMAIYDAFIRKHTGVGANITSATGAAMKKIIKFLKEQVKNKEDLNHEVPFSFKLILDNYEKWLPFHRQQLNLNQIESNLINIITAIKNGVPTNNTNQYQRSKYAPQQ